MLKLKKLKFSGIGRFVEEQIIDFDSLGNLVQLDGQNNNTGGSSGAGKTTVFNALDYLLGVNDTANTVLQSRLTKEGISVFGEFDLDGKALTISRIKGKLSVDLEGDVTTGSSKLSEERLDQILAMPRHLFRPMLHKRQKEGGFFLQFTPKETHEFLTDCLGLSDLREKLEILEKKIKSLEVDRQIQIGVQNSAASALLATQNALNALGSVPVAEVDQDTVLTLKSAYETSSLALEQIETVYRTQNELLEKQRPTINEICPQIGKPVLRTENYDRTIWDNAIKELVLVEGAISLFKETEQTRTRLIFENIQSTKLALGQTEHKIELGISARKNAQDVAREIKKIRESICPTCEQGWVTENAKTKEIELFTKLEAFKTLIAAGDEAFLKKSALSADLVRLQNESLPQINPQLELNLARIKELNRICSTEKTNFDDFNQQQHFVNQKLIEDHAFRQKKVTDEFQANQKVVLDIFAVKQKAIKDSYTAESTEFRNRNQINRSAFESAVGKLKAYTEAFARYETSLKTLKAQEIDHLTTIDTVTQKLTTLDQELAFVEELRRAIKSYASCSFDDALDAIGDTATRIIRNIPNMANATIQLEGTKETKEGKVKEEVNAVISLDGDLGVSIKSLSGGERSSVDLAVDLAVIDLIESKTGKGIDIFILDEPFTGLDTISIEMALEVLKNSNLNKRLVLVDHNPEVKQMVESRLTVVRDGTTSKVTQL